MKSTLESRLATLAQESSAELASCNTIEDLERIRVAYLGRQGHFTHIMGELKNLSADEKREMGPLCNALKQKITEQIQAKQTEFVTRARAEKEAAFVNFDVTAYEPHRSFGSLHPYSLVIHEIEDIFTSMGFSIADGPEIETDTINFEALNIPADHPARDMHDTFWLDIPHLLLRTHMSTVQVRSMQNNKPPLAVVAPGRCYRHEATDASHDFMFMQCEGLFIDKKVSLAELFATIKEFLQRFFNKEELSIRLRPSYFPFVEPGVEIDMTCPFCTTGCSTCKKTGWIEICGAGLVHPHVLRSAGIDTELYSGFAFGFGLTRLVMLKYGINDIRLLHEGKLEFLQQFSSYR